MDKFEVREDDFYLDDRPFKILSGAVHYFRIDPTDWKHSLYNLKALGFNTVETYVPWNIHEMYENNFEFKERYDVKKFIEIAQKLDLLVIIRPSPYICAEWEFGGFPAWLLKKKIRIRSSDEKYLKYVKRYYKKLFKILTPLQITKGGPIIMMQIENEYGSYGEDHEYLRKLKKIMESLGVDVPLFTSDGSWLAVMRAGSLILDGVLQTANFGSHSLENLSNLQKFQLENNKKQPLMCMEFWDGWFNRWGEKVVKRDSKELVKEIKDVIQLGSINLYMFHGGTNFGFMNGCSARKDIDLPQVTSYDYGALLNEQGNPTEKYYLVKKMLSRALPEIKQKEPKIKKVLPKKTVPLDKKVSLFNVYDQISKTIKNKYPQTMECLDNYYGYVLYRTTLVADGKKEKFRIIDARDRIQFFYNKEKIKTQYQNEIGDEIEVLNQEVNSTNEIAILVENMGRVNYGSKLFSTTQHKGIKTGVMYDLHFILNWKMNALDFKKINQIDYSLGWQANVPSFYKYVFELNDVYDTYLDMSGFGKGIVMVNGFNIGRFWKRGPIKTLYVPHGLLKKGRNTIVVFETEGEFLENLKFVEKPIEKGMEE